jgi:uncharacterized protein (TIRG00374 family)
VSSTNPDSGSSLGSKAPSIDLKKRFFSIPTLAGYTLAIVVLGFAVSEVFDIDWSETWNLVRSTNPWLYISALLMYYLSFWFRGWRWNLIARSAGLDESTEVELPSILNSSLIILQGWFANSVAFMRLGDAYRGYAYSRESGARFSVSLGTVVGERAQDVVIVLMLLVIATGGMLAIGTTGAPIWVVIAALLLVVILILLLVGMKFYGNHISSMLPQRVGEVLRNVSIGALASFRLKDVPGQFSLGIAAWFLEMGRLLLVARGMGLEIDIFVVLFATLAGSMLSTIPTPGGIGFVEGGMTGVLVLLGLSDTDAFALTVVDRTISLISIVVIGGVVFFAWQIYRVKYPAHTSVELDPSEDFGGTNQG